MASGSGDIPLIVITGANGFIATHTIKLLQQDGYRVRGTVRSLKDKQKIRHLENLCPGAKFKLELTEADLLKPDSWESVIRDAAFVIHLASPNPVSMPDDENEVIQPAVEGTLNVLKACVRAKTVKRVVLTSSVAAIRSVGVSGKTPCTEDDWNDLRYADPYSKSKTLAEKAAWEFVEDLPVADKFELAVINPTFVVGEVLNSTLSQGLEVIQRLLERNPPVLPIIQFDVVDVQDVALAHMKALFTPGAAGHRHLIGSTNMWIGDIAAIYAEEFKNQGYNVSTLYCPSFILWIYSWFPFFDKSLKKILPTLGKEYYFDNTRMRNILGIQPRDVKPALIDMAHSMIEKGLIKRAWEYKGRLANNYVEVQETFR